MKRWLAYLLLGLVSYVGFMLWLLPASFVYERMAGPLHRQLPQLELAGVEGRLWDGSVEQVSFTRHSLGKVHWKLKLLPLLWGQVSLPVHFQLPGGYLEGSAALPFSADSFRLQALKGQLSLAQIQNEFAYYPVSVDGTLALDISQVELDNQGKLNSLAGNIRWLGAEVVAPQALRLGDLEAELKATAEGGIEADLKDRGGPLSLDAVMSLGRSGRYTLRGSVAPASEADASLRQALDLLGRPGADGRYRLQWQGQL